MALAVAVAVSIAFNIVQYQRSESLQQSLLKLEAEKSQALNMANSDNNRSPVAQNTRQHLLANDGAAAVATQSIAAVAVRAVPVTDGLFQTVRYEGTVIDITVDIRDDGEGLILVDTEIPTGVDFQSSAKTAVKVAQTLTNTDLSTKDIIFSITAAEEGAEEEDLQAVDGGSAGAAMTILLVSQLQGVQQLNQSVLVTGTINPDGTIGQVGAVPQKAEAAGEYGAKLFLVPQGQAVYAAESCHESREGPILYRTCKSEQKPLSELTGQKFGMQVVEVGSVSDALEYFYQASSDKTHIL